MFSRDRSARRLAAYLAWAVLVTPPLFGRQATAEETAAEETATEETTAEETTAMDVVRGAHLRIARPTDDLEPVVAFYRDGLGFEVLASFEDHDGFDGVMLGHEGAGYHLELTHERGHEAGRAPNKEHLLIFYFPDPEAWQKAVDQLVRHGHSPVRPNNPYWESRAKTFEDPDGYRVVLANFAWD